MKAFLQSRWLEVIGLLISLLTFVIPADIPFSWRVIIALGVIWLTSCVALLLHKSPIAPIVFILGLVALLLFTSFQLLSVTREIRVLKEKVAVGSTELVLAHATQTAQARTVAALEATRSAQVAEIAAAYATQTVQARTVAALQAQLTPTGMLSVRSGPSSLYHPAVGEIRQGDVVTALAEYTNRDDQLWYKIEVTKGKFGWVPASSVRRANPDTILPVECPLLKDLVGDEEMFKALIEAERQAVLEESNLKRNGCNRSYLPGTCREVMA